MLKDTFKKLRYVFEMPELDFFSYYNENKQDYSSKYGNYSLCKEEYLNTLNSIPELPFGNVWIAKKMSSQMPKDCVVHFGMLNSLRSWNFFQLDESIDCYANVGGFGIDGGVSSLVGSSLAHPEKIHFGIFGDLAFFYGFFGGVASRTENKLDPAGNFIVRKFIGIKLFIIIRRNYSKYKPKV